MRRPRLTRLTVILMGLSIGLFTYVAGNHATWDGVTELALATTQGTIGEVVGATVVIGSVSGVIAMTGCRLFCRIGFLAAWWSTARC